jgi:hypothetical protein
VNRYVYHRAPSNRHPTVKGLVRRNGRRDTPLVVVRLYCPPTHLDAIAAMHAVHAASLRALTSPSGEGGQDKQEPAGTGIPTGSTAPTSVLADGRAASAHFATDD